MDNANLTLKEGQKLTRAELDDGGFRPVGSFGDMIIYGRCRERYLMKPLGDGFGVHIAYTSDAPAQENVVYLFL